ncbi:MAG: AbrB/MazE/SpoVT family DNA-binding domain-containing protein [Candidatus Baldrarchaeia archaeon]
MEEYVVSVTNRYMITIPARLRRKYGIEKGAKLLIRDVGNGILIVPPKSFEEMFGIDKNHKEVLLEAIKELDREHREEATHD